MMHIVAGPGTMPRAEARAILTDLWNMEDQATPTGSPVPMYVTLQAQAEPTEAHMAILEWLHEQNLPYYVIGNAVGPQGEPAFTSPAYNGATFVMAHDVTPMALAQNQAEQGVPSQVLGLYADPYNDNQADVVLNSQIEACLAAGITCKMANAQMFPLTTKPEPAAQVLDPAQTAVVPPELQPPAPMPVQPGAPAAAVPQAPLDPAQAQLQGLEQQAAALPPAPATAPATEMPTTFRWPTDAELDEMSAADIRTLGRELLSAGLMPDPGGWRPMEPIKQAIRDGRLHAGVAPADTVPTPPQPPTPAPQPIPTPDPALQQAPPTSPQPFPGQQAPYVPANTASPVANPVPTMEGYPLGSPDLAATQQAAQAAPPVAQAPLPPAPPTNGAAPAEPVVTDPTAGMTPQLSSDEFMAESRAIIERHALDRALGTLEWNLTNHTPDADQVSRIEYLRAVTKALGTAIYQHTPRSREQSLAITNLEQTLFWSVAAVARYGDDQQPDQSERLAGPGVPSPTL